MVYFEPPISKFVLENNLLFNKYNFKIFIINSKILYYSSDILSEDNFISDKYWEINDNWQNGSFITEKEVWKHIKLLSFK